MVIFSFELIKDVFNYTFFIDKEADAVQTVIHFTHNDIPLEIF